MNIKEMEKVAQRAREVFLSYEGVLGVGYGLKSIKDKETAETAILVFVEKKLPYKEVKQDELIPQKFSGISTDVVEVHFDKEKDKADGTGLYEGKPMAEFFDWGKIHQLNLKQKRRLLDKNKKTSKEGENPENPQAANNPLTEVRGNLFIIEDNGTLVYTTAGGVKIVDFVGAWNLFRNQFGDDYDFPVFFLDNTDPSFPYMGNFSQPIFRDATETGYGAPRVNLRATWGGSNRLLRMACHSWYTLRTMLHEIGHQWLFYANYRNSAAGPEQTLLHESWDSSWSAGQKDFHPGRWVDNDRSCMDYEHLDWIEVSTGVYRTISPADGDFNFCPLDQYLMGILHPEAVSSSRVVPPSYSASGGDVQIINSPTLRPDGDYNSTPVNITPQNIIWNEGNRNPDHLNSQRIFHQAVIAITFDRVTYAGFLTNSETNRQNHATNWRRATSGRSVIDTSLLRTNIGDIHIRDNTSDTGGTFPGGDFWNSPDIFVRNQDDDPALFLDPTMPNDTIHQNPISNQDNWVYARIHNKSGTNYENVSVNFYMANFNGFSGRDTVAEAVPRTQLMYPIDWHPDSLIGSAVLTNVPSNGTSVAKVLWTPANIPPTNWHPCLLVEIIPLGTTPNKLHHVWENRKLAQKNLHIEYISGDFYEFEFPFVIGHSITNSKVAFLELQKSVDLPELNIYLNPQTALSEIQEIGGHIFHKIPGIEKLDRKILNWAIANPSEGCGVFVSIPKSSSLGIGCGNCKELPENLIQVTFCNDTQLLINPKTSHDNHQEYLPIVGFKAATVESNKLLQMTGAQLARLPFSLKEIKDHKMSLKIRLTGKRLEKPVTLHIVHREEKGRVVGGIEIQLRPQ